MSVPSNGWPGHCTIQMARPKVAQVVERAASSWGLSLRSGGESLLGDAAFRRGWYMVKELEMSSEDVVIAPATRTVGTSFVASMATATRAAPSTALWVRMPRRLGDARRGG